MSRSGGAQVAVLRYNAGNIRSVVNALERLGVPAQVTDDPQELSRASHVIFPGVGEASSAMSYLRERRLDRVLAELRAPLLGICLGLQLLCTHSEEGATAGIGVFPAAVERIREVHKVPHIGWNSVFQLRGRLFDGLEDQAHFYFVHSYAAGICGDTAARCLYGREFSAALSRGNFHAVQFHPEKSGEAGERLLRNFMALER